MGFKCGLVGLPNVGKSTIFNAFTNLHVDASAYPFCTIDPHVGVVPLEDPRLEYIQRIFKSAKKTETVLEFVDIAGLVQGASKGEGLGNQFLSHIGSVDAIAQVVRCFEDENVAHSYGSLDPTRDVDMVNTELILKDLEIVERHLRKTRTAARTGNSEAKRMVASLEPMVQHLSEEKPLRQMKMTDVQAELTTQLNLLTIKPVLFIANVDENHLSGSPLVDALNNVAARQGTTALPFCGKVQAEIAELDHSEQLEFLKYMGLDESGFQKIVRAGYDLLHLVTFFTANENEARAWTIPKGTEVQKAAGKVHSDFESGFIKAEVIRFEDLKQSGSLKALHDTGAIAVHGRDYIVQDGDIVLFKIRS